MEFRVISRNYRASFERDLEELVKDGWAPMWESFRTEGTPGRGNEGPGKAGYFLLLSRENGNSSELPMEETEKEGVIAQAQGNLNTGASLEKRPERTAPFL